MKNLSEYTEQLMDVVKKTAANNNFAFILPELFLYCLFCEDKMEKNLSNFVDLDTMKKELKEYILKTEETINSAIQSTANNSPYMNDLYHLAETKATSKICCADLVSALFELDGTFAAMLLSYIEDVDKDNIIDTIINVEKNTNKLRFNINKLTFAKTSKATMTTSKSGSVKTNTNGLVQLMNGTIKQPIIGRKKEIERTIQILARATKNNPIHVGEPGVGKTAIVEGLTQMIDNDEVPDTLKNAKVYSLNVGDLMVGTIYRGDLEGRIKKLLVSMEKEDNPILYIDEIHNIVGAGATTGSSMDISNMLKPYLTNGKIKFIGATTEEEYKKFFTKDKALARRFQKISVAEPSISEAIEILNGLKEYYEQYHNISYNDDALKAAVELSVKYVNDRFLPDKAIDLIDEAGAYLNTYGSGKVVDKKLIEEILSKTCNIPKMTVAADETTKLRTLDKEIKSQLYGQDKAVDDIVRAIKISRAGLLEDNKPIASLLMVGPTGVGKTELAKTLASTLGIGLVKFDMSEYMDKTSVNKLIGASSGYVGYEEGGMLVDAIRKQPHCVLLLDEIEKAHPDVFNVLLQVMDDATLTDNQGRKADFKNVIILMTSNAGASEVGKATIGFESKNMTATVMNDAVNKLFTPEFRNRLSGTVVFNDMDEKMATLIAKKQLRLLDTKLHQISIKYTDEVLKYIVSKGLSEKQYGGRAIKRTIENELKPLFVDEILFGKLKNGGSCKIDMKNGTFHLSCRAPFTKSKTKIATAV